MNVIDEMRALKSCYMATVDELLDSIRLWADRLAASGALVPVPDGEPVKKKWVEKMHFLHNGKVYQRMGVISPKCIHGKTMIIPHDDLVQPVKLIPITEAEA